MSATIVTTRTRLLAMEKGVCNNNQIENDVKESEKQNWEPQNKL